VRRARARRRASCRPGPEALPRRAGDERELHAKVVERALARTLGRPWARSRVVDDELGPGRSCRPR
jgi:hypothetical protein